MKTCPRCRKLGIYSLDLHSKATAVCCQLCQAVIGRDELTAFEIAEEKRTAQERQRELAAKEKP